MTSLLSALKLPLFLLLKENLSLKVNRSVDFFLVVELTSCMTVRIMMTMLMRQNYQNSF